MLIRYQNGSLLEAIILSLEGAVLRVAPKDADDVIEFRLINGVWVSDDCELVRFDFTMAVLAAVGIVAPARGAKMEETGVPRNACDDPQIARLLN